MTKEKLSKEDTLKAIYGIIVGGFKEVFDKILDESLDYKIKSRLSEDKNDPFTYFTITNIKDPKKIIETNGLFLGFNEDGSDEFKINIAVASIIKSKFIELADIFKFDKNITNVLGNLFDNEVIKIDQRFINIYPYLVSIIYIFSNNNVIRFESEVEGKIIYTYFIIFDFPLKITKKDEDKVTSSLMLLNDVSSAFTFQRFKNKKKNIKRDTKYKSLSKYIKSKGIERQIIKKKNN